MVKMWEVVFDRFREGDKNREKALFIANSRKLLDLIDMVYEMEAPEGVLVCVVQGLYELNMLKNEAAERKEELIQFTGSC